MRGGRRERGEEAHRSDLVAPPAVPTPAEVLAAQEYAPAEEIPSPQEQAGPEPAEAQAPPARPAAPDFFIRQAEAALPDMQADLPIEPPAEEEHEDVYKRQVRLEKTSAACARKRV